MRVQATKVSDAEWRRSPGEVRQRVRSGEVVGQTSGLAPGYVQGNVVIVPEDAATDFLIYCQRNPKACPLLGVAEAGDPHLPTLGQDIDIRSDVPGYRVFREGELVDTVTELHEIWRGDLVTFVLGCSFSFEEALLDHGIELRHIQQGTNVSMYRTDVATESAGRFRGELVVSMRPLRPADAIRAVQITSRFPRVHGAPVHLGDPSLIGIADLGTPDFGERAEVAADELPVFWACGVTPQVALRNAGLDLCITHDPGSMLVTDLRNSHLSAL